MNGNTKLRIADANFGPQSGNWLPLLLAAYFILVFAVRLSLPDSLEFDESEQVLTAQWLAAGYGTQPPLYNWLQQIAFAVGGVSIATLAAFKNMMLFSIYLIYWYTARRIFQRQEFAIIATLGLLTIPQVVFESQRDLTHTVSVIFSASLFLWALFATLTRPTIGTYLGLGIATACGLLSKYNFALLPAATFLAILFDTEGRKRLLDWRFLLSIVTAIILISPHMLWLWQNFEMASSNTIGKMRGEQEGVWLLQFGTGMLSIGIATIGFSGATILVYLGVFGRRFIESLPATNRWIKFSEHLLLALLFLLVLIVITLGAENIKDRWLSPLLLILPLYLTMKLEASGLIGGAGWRRVFRVALIIMVLVPSILYLRIETARWTGSHQKLNYPYHALVDTILADTGKTPSLVIADNTWIGGNVRLHLQSVPVFSPQFPQFKPQFQWTNERPIIAIWPTQDGMKDQIPPSLEGSFRRFAGEDAVVTIRSVELPYNKGRAGDLIGFTYAIAYPSEQNRQSP